MTHYTSTSAASYHWVLETPGDTSSGSLTIPDSDNDVGGHNIVPLPTGSWTDSGGYIWEPTGGDFSYEIFPDGVLQELSNLWIFSTGVQPHVQFPGEATFAFGFASISTGRWVQDVTTSVPDGGATAALLAFSVAGLALARRKMA